MWEMYSGDPGLRPSVRLVSAGNTAPDTTAPEMTRSTNAGSRSAADLSRVLADVEVVDVAGVWLEGGVCRVLTNGLAD